MPEPARATELPFEVELVHPGTGEVLAVPLQGWIDLIEADGTVVELKTLSRTPDAGALALNLQLSAYSYAASRIYREQPPLRLDVLLKTRRPRFERVPVERGAADDARLFLLAEEALRAIEAQAFFPNPGWPVRTATSGTPARSGTRERQGDRDALAGSFLRIVAATAPLPAPGSASSACLHQSESSPLAPCSESGTTSRPASIGRALPVAERLLRKILVVAVHGRTIRPRDPTAPIPTSPHRMSRRPLVTSCP